MTWYERFAAKKRNFGIENLMAYVSISMLIIFFASGLLNLPITEMLSLNRAMVLNGQVWRLITFALVPATTSPFWIIFSVLMYYSIGRDLETQWGKGVFTLYYLIGMIGAIIAAFITGSATNTYLNLSLVLAFAFLFPDAQFRIYFVLPIKAKYIGYVSLGLYGLSLIYAIYAGIVYKQWSQFGELVASLLNFTLFFGPKFISKIRTDSKNRKRRKAYERELRQGRNGQ